MWVMIVPQQAQFAIKKYSPDQTVALVRIEVLHGKIRKTWKLLSVAYSQASGAELGFQRAGFEIVWANELTRIRVKPTSELLTYPL